MFPFGPGDDVERVPGSLKQELELTMVMRLSYPGAPGDPSDPGLKYRNFMRYNNV